MSQITDAKPTPPALPAEAGLVEEQDRLGVLHRLNLLDTEREEAYDELVQLASEICHTPISLISLVDSERQWFKSTHGTSLTETHRDHSFCAHAIQRTGLFVVEDATADKRFRENPLVTGDPNIRFYAGMPLLAEGNVAVGTLCVLDTVPRSLSSSQREALRILGRQIQTRFELRAQKRAAEDAVVELEASRQLLRKFHNNTPYPAFIKNEDGTYLTCNDSFARHFNLTQEQIAGLSDYDLLAPDVADKFRALDLQVLRGNLKVEGCDHVQTPGGGSSNFRFIKFPLQGAHGKRLVGGVSFDITEEVRRERALADANAELKRLADCDPLTKLFNRRIFEDRLKQFYAIAARNQRPLALLTLDLDNFKRRNDTFGHQAGDEALKEVGRILHDCIRAGDIAARLGGEEFALLLPETDVAQAEALAARVQDELEQLDLASGLLTASFGIAVKDGTTESWDQLLSHSDIAMYEAKRSGRNRVSIYNPAELVLCP